MSKEIIIVGIVLILIISANVWVSRFIDGKLNHIIDELDELEETLSKRRL